MAAHEPYRLASAEWSLVTCQARNARQPKDALTQPRPRLAAWPRQAAKRRGLQSASSLVGARQAALAEVDATRSARKANTSSLSGSDLPRRTNDVDYARCRVRVYPAVDLLYYGNSANLEYDFVVAPERTRRRSMLGFHGADRLEVNAQASRAGMWARGLHTPARASHLPGN